MERLLEMETYAVTGKLFKHESVSIVATEKMMMKNSSETVLEKSYIGRAPSNDGNIFHLVTHSEKHGKENATLKISRDLNSLITDISVYTDENGKLKSIINKHEVLDKWDELKKVWEKEADKEDKKQIENTIYTVQENLRNGSFEKDIANQGALYFLLSGAYRAYSTEEPITVERDLNKFLVTQNLPLNIAYSIADYDRMTGKMVIKGLGEVAPDRLDQKMLNKLIRGLKDKVNMKVELQVSYVEHFYFDKYGWLEKADQKVRVKIPGFYMAETEQKITEIDSYE